MTLRLTEGVHGHTASRWGAAAHLVQWWSSWREDGLGQDRGVSRSTGRLGAIPETGGDPGWGGFGGGEESWVNLAEPGDGDLSAG